MNKKSEREIYLEEMIIDLLNCYNSWWDIAEAFNVNEERGKEILAEGKKIFNEFHNRRISQINIIKTSRIEADTNESRVKMNSVIKNRMNARESKPKSI